MMGVCLKCNEGCDICDKTLQCKPVDPNIPSPPIEPLPMKCHKSCIGCKKNNPMICEECADVKGHAAYMTKIGVCVHVPCMKIKNLKCTECAFKNKTDATSIYCTQTQEEKPTGPPVKPTKPTEGGKPTTEKPTTTDGNKQPLTNLVICKRGQVKTASGDCADTCPVDERSGPNNRCINCPF